MKKLSKGIFCLVVILMGVITINFLNTNNKNLKEVKINDKRLAVFIRQEDGSYKTATSIPQSGYTLNTEKSTCSKGATPTWSNNTLNLANLTTEDTNCYLYFDEDAATKTLNKLGLTSNTGTPDFSQIATTDEGIYATEDGMYGGTSYYWRGAATTNYVKFAGFCWRAIRINGDGTLRLIYDGATCHQNGESTTESLGIISVQYNENDNGSEYVGWTYELGKQRPDNNLTGIASNAKTQTDTWYNTNIGNNGIYASKVADGKFCNDREVAEGYLWDSNQKSFEYAAMTRLHKNKIPTLNCSSSQDVYILKSGAISADEVSYAGGSYAVQNRLYYLYNNHIYWTITPYSKLMDEDSYVFNVSDNGSIGTNRLKGLLVSSDYQYVNLFSLRPVINLKADTMFATGGNGTIDNPFVVEGAE